MEKIGFKGKVIYAYLHGKESVPRVRSARLTTVGHRLFLSGTLVTTDPKHWAEGKTIHIPFDRIESIIEFGNEAEYSTYIEKLKKQPAPVEAKKDRVIRKKK